MSKILYAGISDPGYNRTLNEDFVHVKEFDKNVYFAVVADGAGSINSKFQPGALAGLQIEENLKRIHQENPDALNDYPEIFLREAMIAASYSLGTFRMVDEETYAGFAASVSCVLLDHSKVTLAHSGNTRINLMRLNKKTSNYDIVLLTKDHTKGIEKVDKGEITWEEYHLDPARLEITGGLGMMAQPNIQTFSTKLRNNDFLLLTSDGIHNALRPEHFFEILKRSNDCEETVKALIMGAKQEQYDDNMSAVLIWYSEDQA